MRKAHAKDEEEGEDDEQEEVPLEREVICNCMAFLATTMVVVGELMSERNLWAVIVIGGGLSAINIIITSAGLDAVAVANGMVEDSLPERTAAEDMHHGTAVAIDIDEEKVEPQRQRHRERDRDRETREGRSGTERHRREKARREGGKKHKPSRKKEKSERREKKDRRTKKKRRAEESGLHTVVQV